MDNGYHSPQVWEVIGGADKGGVIVRVDEEISSTPFPDRLTTGSLVMEVELVGDRLCYDRIAGTGAGPDSGWVSVRLGLKELLVPIDVKPPRSGWRVVHKDLPTWVPPRPRPERPAITDGSQGPSQWRDEDEMVGAGPGSAVGPEYAQISGQPFAYYHKVCFSDTKPTGLRMSACLGTMEECRADTFTLCDQTVDSFKKVTDPFILVALELHPAIADFSPSKSEDGLLYAHPSSKGPIMTWLRNEVQFGWPMFPLRTEEQIIYAVGKNPRSSERRAIATGRFIEALVDEQTDGMLQGLKWQEDMDRFFAALKSNHSNPRLDEAKLHNLYRSSGKPFKPNIMTKEHRFKISQIQRESKWIFSFGAAGLFHHEAKTPETKRTQKESPAQTILDAMAAIEMQEVSSMERGLSTPLGARRPIAAMLNPSATLACTCCFLIYMLQIVGIARSEAHNFAGVSVLIPWLREQDLVRSYFGILGLAYLPSFAWAMVECLRSSAVDVRRQAKSWSEYTTLMASLMCLCIFELIAGFLLDIMGSSYVNGLNANDPFAVFRFVCDSALSVFMQTRLFAYADHIMGGPSSCTKSCCPCGRQEDPSKWQAPRGAGSCVLLSLMLLAVRVYHDLILFLGWKGASSLWAIVRLARVMIRFLMAGANAIRSKAYANHPLSEHLSAQMRSNMATQSKMLMVAGILAGCVDFAVVAKGFSAPDKYFLDITDFELDVMNNLFTQWLPITLLITGTIDKRAPQPHINDLRACGFANGLVIFFLYLGTFLFGAWGGRALLFPLSESAVQVSLIGGPALVLAKTGAGMMYFCLPALFLTVFPFVMHQVQKTTSVTMPMWPGEGLTYITYHRNAAHLFILALTVHTGGHIWTFANAGGVDAYTGTIWGGGHYAWLWPWVTGCLLVTLGLSLYVAYWALKRRCYDFFIRNKRVLGVVLLVLAGSHGFTSNFGQPRLWWFCLLILCMWAIDKRIKSEASGISCSQEIVKMKDSKGNFNGAILVLKSKETFQEVEPGAVLLQVVGVNGRHPLTQVAYPCGTGWKLEYHIRLMPSVEKQNWAHRLYDHARAREGSEEGIDLEVAGPMSTLGTFGQEELLKDVHHIILVAIGVGFTGCVHPLFHAYQEGLRADQIRLCIRTPSPEQLGSSRFFWD
ncbi:unnamed protein product [Durusdinium trenchii]|uniref:FAD-binding FR-type domain-containing protein n=1 Tax=Durusdinium trenchii TaxID=1381693 RepID=A0ABP0IGV8_9DINO